jgi:predicted nucleic acid-binding protein
MLRYMLDTNICIYVIKNDRLRRASVSMNLRISFASP